MEWIANNTPIIITAMGVIAAVVSIITEMTKEIGFLNKIPTILQVIVLSIVLWIILFFGACSAGVITYSWFILIAAIIAGFITAYISSYGWEKFDDIFKRYKKG